VTWHSFGTTEDFLESRSDLTIRGYLHWVENGHYSAILTDGSLLQITYEFTAGSISGHRLAFVPCPVDVTDQDSQDLIEEGWPWGEVIRSRLDSVEDVHMKTSIRFDFDAHSAALDHPASHFTINTVDCRIACATPVRLGRFLDFVFRTFYPGLYRDNEYLQSFTKTGWFDSRIDDEHRNDIHFSWTS
jgi:hypothetical protein